MTLAERLLCAHGWVFPGQKPGTHLTSDRVGRLMRKASQGEWSTHQLRHRFASTVYNATGDLLSTHTPRSAPSPRRHRRMSAWPTIGCAMRWRLPHNCPPIGRQILFDAFRPLRGKCFCEGDSVSRELSTACPVLGQFKETGDSSVHRQPRLGFRCDLNRTRGSRCKRSSSLRN